MKDEPTPEMIAMARRIVEGTRIDGPLGLGPPDAFKAALAAIIETTELAYRLAADHVDQCEDTTVGRARNGAARDIYEALRDGDHLKGPNNG